MRIRVFGVGLVKPESLGFVLERVVDQRDPDGTRLILREAEPDSGAKALSLSVDFLDERLLYRLTHGFGPSQPLGRALGLKKAREPWRVLDATAGLGTDAVLMAALGCRVRAVERSPIVAALLLDGMDRLRKVVSEAKPDSPLPLELLRKIVSHVQIEEGDSSQLLANLRDDECPDVVFVDPMFPEETRSDSALPKKGMQVFRKLIGEDLDADRLFEVALSRARDRVVVKRPIGAPDLGGRKATSSIEGKSSRLDMYLCRRS